MATPELLISNYNKFREIFHRILLITTIISILNGCSATNDLPQLARPLADRGLLFLSGDNPYLGPNLVIAEIASSSPLFYNFLNHQGAPAAIKIESEYLSAPTIKMFYPEGGVYFSLVRANEDWIAEGPFKIEATDLSQLSVSTNKGSFILTPEQFQNINKEEDSTKSAITPIVGLTITPDFASLTPTTIASLPPERLPQAKNPSLPIDVNIIADGNQSWESLANWYTNDPSNAGRIARLNGDFAGVTPEKGKKIFIPGYMVVRTDPMIK